MQYAAAYRQFTSSAEPRKLALVLSQAVASYPKVLQVSDPASSHYPVPVKRRPWCVPLLSVSWERRERKGSFIIIVTHNTPYLPTLSTYTHYIGFPSVPRVPRVPPPTSFPMSNRAIAPLTPATGNPSRTAKRHLVAHVDISGPKQGEQVSPPPAVPWLPPLAAPWSAPWALACRRAHALLPGEGNLG